MLRDSYGATSLIKRKIVGQQDVNIDSSLKRLLPRAFEVFGEAGAIGNRVLAEEYALGTAYKGFTNANRLITNNPTFDLFNLGKQAIVDVTTLDGKQLAWVV